MLQHTHDVAHKVYTVAKRALSFLSQLEHEALNTYIMHAIQSFKKPPESLKIHCAHMSPSAGARCKPLKQKVGQAMKKGAQKRCLQIKVVSQQLSTVQGARRNWPPSGLSQSFERFGIGKH